jgi:putative N6-adenine-specific DNA methylase
MLTPSRFDTLSLFAATPPGLEAVTAAELERLGVSGAKVVSGGVVFFGDLATLYRINLWCRTAQRVLVRLDAFFAVHLAKLHKKLQQIPWEYYVNPNLPVTVRATCRKSRIYHSVAAAERGALAIQKRLGLDETPVYGEGAPRQSDAGTTVVLRLERDHCMVSLDSSGEHLHRRGYRIYRHEAPLRENLAAAVLFSLGFDGKCNFWDPMCGSGTLPIEAAMIAANIPPGLNRTFAFMHWPVFDGDVWRALLDEANRSRRVSDVLIGGSDKQASAVRMSREHAEAAGVAQWTSFQRTPVHELTVPTQSGVMASNPPYGKRIGDRRKLCGVYHQLGEIAIRHLDGWQLGILTTDSFLVEATGLDMRPVGPLFPNGGIRVRLYSTVT